MFGTPQYSATGFSDGNFNVNGAITLTGQAITSSVASVTLSGAGNITVTTAGVVTSATNNVTPGGGAGISVDGLLITAGEGGIAGFFTTVPEGPDGQWSEISNGPSGSWTEITEPSTIWTEIPS